MPATPSRRSGTRLGKYKIVRRIAEGGFATVYRARDTVEGIDVALKIPLASEVDPRLLEEFTREARVTAGLEHANILSLKNADVIEGTFVLAYRLGDESLADRLERRIGTPKGVDWSEQLLRGLAHAHASAIIHCDIKPDNIILFPGGNLRLADFGIARVREKTRTVSGSGTIGYMAPEQALGRPSPRSDVFSACLTIHRLLGGLSPRWPFEWPPPRHERVQQNAPESSTVLRRGLKVDARQRFANAGELLEAFVSARKRWERRRRRET